MMNWYEDRFLQNYHSQPDYYNNTVLNTLPEMWLQAAIFE